MKTTAAVLCLLAMAAPSVRADEGKINPLGKVVELLDSLSAKIAKEGEEELAAYKEFADWCKDASTNLQYDIKTAKAKEEKLSAKIEELASDIEVAASKTEELAQKISVSEADLKAATMVREKEAADFAASEKELMETVDTLERALQILEKEYAKNPAAFAQVDTSSLSSMLGGLSAVVEAASFPSNDAKKLMALVQSASSEDDDQEPGAPAAAVYKSHSGNIIDVLEDLKEKAEVSLAELRKEESNSQHNYNMLKQHLEDLIVADNKDLEEEKAAGAAASEGKAAAEADLGVTTKAREASEASLKTAADSCMQTAADHEATVASRKEELKAIATAREILMKSTAGAVEQTYSFLQVGASQAASMLMPDSHVLKMIQHLAKKHHSAALAQLASRISAVIKYAGGQDPFAKVKGLIQSLIEKLEKEAEAEATEKAYCDEEMAKTEAKKSELTDDITSLTTKIDQKAAKSAELKEDVKELQKELGDLSKMQAEMDKARADEKAAYTQAKAELEEGLAGVRKALTVLRDYYMGGSEEGEEAEAAMLQQPEKPKLHEKATGAGGSIIEILEVVESDFADNLAKEEQEESDAVAEYEKTTQENKITKATKEQDVKYKTQEFTTLDKTIAELSSDREGLSTELAAVEEYLAKLKDRCVAKPETYEERKARREAEIQGLKEALAALEGQAAFVQRHRRHGSMRGARLAAQ